MPSPHGSKMKIFSLESNFRSVALLLALLLKPLLNDRAVRGCSKVNILPIMSQLANILIWFKSTPQRIELCLNVISSDTHQYSRCRKQFSLQLPLAASLHKLQGDGVGKSLAAIRSPQTSGDKFSVQSLTSTQYKMLTWNAPHSLHIVNRTSKKGNIQTSYTNPLTLFFGADSHFVQQ